MYQALVFVHIVGVVVFAAAHGVSMFVAYQVRRQRDPRSVAMLLTMSKRAVLVSHGGMLLLGVGGLGAAAVGGLLLAPWVVASAIVLVAVGLIMGMVATPYYVGLRAIIGVDGAAPSVESDELERRLVTSRPDILLAVGGIGALVLLWLMVSKPG